MNVRWRQPAGRMRPGLTMPELLVGIVVFGVLGFLVLARFSTTPRMVTSSPTMVAPALVEPLPPPSGGEMSLQETLDRLGYTVNVPRSLYGRPLRNWCGYRVSTEDDAIDAEWFEGGGGVQFQDLCRQSDYGGRTTFGALTVKGERIPLLRGSSSRFGRGSTHGLTVESGLPTAACFYIDYSTGGGQGLLYSVTLSNPGRGPQLIVIPARTGGLWVDEGNNRGHWEGGEESGDYLLCWEDLVRDDDFQDVVVLARGIRPAARSGSMGGGLGWNRR
jgi:hypothetical protein